MHTTTNLLLVNLSVGDIIVLVWCPRLYSFLIETHPSGLLGDYWCKLFNGNAIVGVAIASSLNAQLRLKINLILFSKNL